MALKSNFEDASFISSPFVDEIANPGKVVRAASVAQLESQGSGAVEERKTQLTEEAQKNASSTNVATRREGVNRLGRIARGDFSESDDD